MGFLQPLALLGLAAVAVPPLLHLLAKRMPPVVVFPALRYLKATEREHSRRLKLRNLLLMLLRMAVIALIVLAASRPVANVGAGGMHQPTAVAIIVDNSLSSGAVVSGRTVLDRLRNHANQLLADLAVGDELWVITADGQPRRMGRTEAAAMLDTLKPSPVRLDIANAARQAASVVERSSLGTRAVLVLSDLQATAFSTGDHIATRSVWLDAESATPNRGIDSAFAEPVLWSPGGIVVVGVSGDEGNAAAVQVSVGDVVLTRAVATPGAH
ncbi:MAG: BatA and WFA domain-containing protein, partial [Gemmatimonadales bacterium]